MVSVSLLAGPLHLTGETKRELAEEGLEKHNNKKNKKKQADKLESEQMNDVCLYAQRKWLIM